MCPQISSGRPRDQLQRFMQGQLVINSCDLRLAPKVPDSAPSYIGPGSITQTNKGELGLRLFCVEEPNRSDLEGVLQLDSNIQAGDRLPDSSFHVLQATDILGQDWSADYVQPEPQIGPCGTVVAADLSNLSTESELPASSSTWSLRLGFKSSACFPANTVTKTKKEIAGEERLVSAAMDKAAFSACGYDFTLHSKDRWIVLAATSENAPHSPNVDLRMREALQFALDEYFQWSFRIQVTGIQRIADFRPFPKPLRPEQLYPPIRLHKVDPTGKVWNLFDKYLQHVIDYEDADHLHPLSTLVRSVVASEKSALEAQALSLSVAVEGILKAEFAAFGLPPDELHAEIDIARTLIDSNNDLSDDFKNRVRGSLSAMPSPRAKDRLKALHKDGVVSKDLVDAYDDLRNRAAHAHFIADGPKSSPEVAQLMKLIQQVRQLFHKLVFLAIGYTGPYNDYSTRNWPEKEFQATVSYG